MRSRRAQEAHDHGYFTTAAAGTASDPVSSSGRALLDDNTWGAVGGGDVTIPARDRMVWLPTVGTTSSYNGAAHVNIAPYGTGLTAVSSNVSIADDATGRQRLTRGHNAGTAAGGMYINWPVALADNAEEGDTYVFVFSLYGIDPDDCVFVGFSSTANAITAVTSGAPGADDIVGVSIEPGGDWLWCDNGTTSATGIVPTTSRVLRLTMTIAGGEWDCTLEEVTGGSGVSTATMSHMPSDISYMLGAFKAGATAGYIYYHRWEGVAKW